ncbi:MAG TPA: VCBS repeat-containing protein [Cyclobacteriaceae bacterium]|nr:VCBS repeat-containing protein [Cyclobacteriaceae bacterium]
MKRNSLYVVMAIFFSCTNNRTLQFEEMVIEADGPEWCWTKAAADVNGDSIDDLLIGGYNGGGVWFYLSPDYRKEQVSDWTGAKTDAEILDIDNDGDKDVVCLFDHTIWWFSNPGWNPHFIDSLTAHDLEAADMDGDGLSDLIARDQGEFNSRGDTLFLIKHYREFQWMTRKIIIPNGEGLKVSDLNADGKPDIIVNGLWLENTGVMTNWGKHAYSELWTWPNTYIDAADINGDSRKDILVAPSELAGNYYRLSWFEQGNDPFVPWEEHVVVDSIETVLHFTGLADFNLDGKTDIAYAEMKQGLPPHEVAVLTQLKNSWSKTVLSNGGSHSMRITDLDGDGDADLYGANWQEDTVKIWINNIR